MISNSKREALGVDDQVQFRGFVPYEHVADEIAQADVCICPLPDRLEWNVSSPLKVFEYMACAKPMILTPIPAPKGRPWRLSLRRVDQGFEPQHFHGAIVEGVRATHRIALAPPQRTTC